MQNQYERLDEAIRPSRFVHNFIIRAWMDGQVKSRNDAYTYCKILADNPAFLWYKSWCILDVGNEKFALVPTQPN